jgi:hypothetical protein
MNGAWVVGRKDDGMHWWEVEWAPPSAENDTSSNVCLFINTHFFACCCRCEWYDAHCSYRSIGTMPTFIQMMIVKCGYVVQLDTESRRKYGIRKCGIRKCGIRKLMN